MEEIRHITENGKYRMVIERAASTKGIDGFKVEANGDIKEQVLLDVLSLYKEAIELTKVATNG